MGQGGNTLNCLFVNSRSLLCNFKHEELELLCREREVDILGVTETWLHAGVGTGEIDIEGFNVYRRDRGEIKGGRGGGVLLYIRKELKSRVCDFNSGFKCEGLVCEIGDINRDGLYVGIFYRPPNAEEGENEEVFRLIRKISNKAVVIMGDFNYPGINWEGMESDNNGERFFQLVSDCFLFQHVKSPTRGQNILDLVLTSEEGMVEGVKVDEPLVTSDHRIAYFKLSYAIDRGVDNYNSRSLNFHKADYGNINRELGDVNWEYEFCDLSAQDMWNKFLCIVNLIVNKCAFCKESRQGS